jgi:hypothetical protein
MRTSGRQFRPASEPYSADPLFDPTDTSITTFSYWSGRVESNDNHCHQRHRRQPQGVSRAPDLTRREFEATHHNPNKEVSRLDPAHSLVR